MITREDIQVNIRVKDDQLKRGGKNLRWFKMEMLGVMFFGLAMQRTFSNMLKPAAEAFGLFDLWGATLQVVFIPIMQILAPLLIDLMTTMMGLPEPLKVVIGGFAVLGFVLGTALFLIGQLTLAWGSIMKAFPLIASAIQSVIGWFSALSAGVLTVFGVILAIIIGFVMAWQTNFGKIQEWVRVIWEGIKNIFAGGFKFIIGFLTLLVGIFTLNFDKIGEGWKKMWSGFGETAFGFIQVIVGIVTTIGLSILRVIVGVINSAIGLINKIPGVNLSKISVGETSGLVNEVNPSTSQKQIVINQTNNVSGLTTDQVNKQIAQNNKDLYSQIIGAVSSSSRGR